MGFEIERDENELSSLPLLSLNHVSFVCKSVATTARFYQEVLGFMLIKRPSSFNFKGAWLFNYGIGIHLLECDSPADAPIKKGVINPKDNHISFQCSDMQLLMRKLEALNIDYVTAVVMEGGVKVDQLFFHDPDGYMIEICNCDNLPVLPLSSCPLKKPSRHEDQYTPPFYGKKQPQLPVAVDFEKKQPKLPVAVDVETLMMQSLVSYMMDISL